MADSNETVQGGVAALQPEGGGATLQALSRIEELLKEQTEQNRKLLRASRWRTIFLLALVVTFIVAGFAFYNVLTAITREIPRVLEEVDDLIANAKTAIQTIVRTVDSVNIDALNESIEGIAKIDYDGLNTSIEGLASAVQGFQTFVDALSHPANAIGSLFGG